MGSGFYSEYFLKRLVFFPVSLNAVASLLASVFLTLHTPKLKTDSTSGGDPSRKKEFQHEKPIVKIIFLTENICFRGRWGNKNQKVIKMCFLLLGRKGTRFEFFLMR